jgi:predicted permease
MTPLLRLLIALFPPSFRDHFGEDMGELYRDQLNAARARGRIAVLRLQLRTIAGMTRSALVERWSAPRQPRTVSADGLLIATGRDLRLAFRALGKSPMFALVAVLCIALGSGAVTTIFSTMNALIFRPLPGTTAGDRLVRIERKKPNEQDGISASYPFYQQVHERSRALSEVVAWGKASLVIRRGDEAGTEVYGNLVSGNLFSVFGVKPLLGRFFSPEEDATELTHPVIVVSEDFWRTQLAGDHGAIGRELLVNGHPFRLIGVAPREFQGMDTPIKVDAYAPIHMQRWLRTTPGPLTDAQGIWLRLGGRLAPGATAAAVHAELSGIAAAVGASGTEPQWMQPYTDLRVSQLMGLPPDATDTLAGFLGLLLGAAALVLIIASVNVAALLGARAIGRQREMAVRAALGASRARLARQLLAETLVLFTVGAAGGALVAYAATSALERIPIPSDVPFSLILVPDLRVLGFTLLMALATGLIVGLAPIRQAVSTNVEAQLRNGAGTGTARRSLVGSALIVAQLAVSLVLLVGAGLFMRALERAGEVEKGFVTEGVLTVPLDTESWGYDEARGRRFYADLSAAVSRLPSVGSTSYTTIVPLNFQRSGGSIELPGDDRQGEVPIQQLMVDPGYFDVLRIPLTAGRAFGSDDVAGRARVAVINETMARRHWKNGDALGRTFRIGGNAVTVIGVARDAKYASLDEATPPMAYFPLQQEWRARRKLVVRVSSDPLAFAPILRDAIHQVDANAPRVVVTTLTEATGFGLIPQRVAAMVTGVLGAVGLILSMAGLYGVVSYSAARRTREVGIRMALGAQARDVLRMMLREGVRLIVPGVIAGMVLAAMATRLMTSLLLGVSPLDLTTYLLMPLLLMGVALLASYLPARRAAAAEPVSVLKAD